MGLRGEAAIVGYTELPAPKKPAGPPEFTLEQWARLAAAALADAGLSAADVDGICTGHLQESQIFVPSTVIEYLGVKTNFAELVDLGGASAVAMAPSMALPPFLITAQPTSDAMSLAEMTMPPLAR